MKRYVIMAKENYPGASIKEICRCDTNAKVIRDALADYTVTGSQGTRIYKFNHVEILEVSARKPKEARAQMKKPMRNTNDHSGKPDANQLLSVFTQIDAMRAANGAQAQPAAQSDPAGTESGPATAAPKAPAPRA
jgi:hypothetical protein